MAKILIVEDNHELRHSVCQWLTHEHYSVEEAKTGKEALEKLQCFSYDAVILDWNLPDLTGLEILQNLRSLENNTPVLMLTGQNSISYKEAGFSAGADDYLTKPFHIKELSARVMSLIRRASQTTSQILQVKDITLDPARHRVTKAGKEAPLLPKEFALLEFLMRNKDKVFSAEALLDRVWSSDSDASIDAITTCIKRIRKKLDTPESPSIIHTVHGIGYKIESN